MLRLLVAVLPTLFSAMRSRRHLVIENLALRQQLASLAGRRHPDIRPADRVFWVLLHLSPDVKRDAVKLLDLPGRIASVNLTAPQPVVGSAKVETPEMAPGWRWEPHYQRTLDCHRYRSRAHDRGPHHAEHNHRAV